MVEVRFRSSNDHSCWPSCFLAALLLVRRIRWSGFHGPLFSRDDTVGNEYGKESDCNDIDYKGNLGFCGHVTTVGGGGRFAAAMILGDAAVAYDGHCT